MRSGDDDPSAGYNDGIQTAHKNQRMNALEFMFSGMGIPSTSTHTLNAYIPEVYGTGIGEREGAKR